MYHTSKELSNISKEKISRLNPYLMIDDILYIHWVR